MAREIVVWCDPCMADDTRTDGREVTVALGGGKPKVVALCASHEDQLIKPLQVILDEYGETPETVAGVKASPKGPRQVAEQAATRGTRHGIVPTGGRPIECLWCGLTYSIGGGFGRHLRVAHGYDGIVEAFGGICPVCGGGPYEQMKQHCGRSHRDMDFRSVSDPFIWAKENGDPHGVYAAKLVQEPSMTPEEQFARVRSVETKYER